MQLCSALCYDGAIQIPEYLSNDFTAFCTRFIQLFALLIKICGDLKSTPLTFHRLIFRLHKLSALEIVYIGF
jgi:hypothetical protein